MELEDEAKHKIMGLLGKIDNGYDCNIMDQVCLDKAQELLQKFPSLKKEYQNILDTYRNEYSLK